MRLRNLCAATAIFTKQPVIPVSVSPSIIIFLPCWGSVATQVLYHQVQRSSRTNSNADRSARFYSGYSASSYPNPGYDSELLLHAAICVGSGPSPGPATVALRVGQQPDLTCLKLFIHLPFSHSFHKYHLLCFLITKHQPTDRPPEASSGAKPTLPVPYHR